MLDAGTYKARATEAALGTAQTGTEQVAVALEIIDGDFAGTTITWYGFFTEKTTDRTLESLRYLGWQGDDITDLAGIDRHVVDIVVEHEADRQGVPRARVKWINRGGGLAMRERMDPGAAASLAKRIKGRAVASRVHAVAGEPTAQHRTVTVPQRQQPPKRSAAAGDGGFPPMDDYGSDDIPF